MGYVKSLFHHQLKLVELCRDGGAVGTNIGNDLVICIFDVHIPGDVIVAELDRATPIVIVGRIVERLAVVGFGTQCGFELLHEEVDDVAEIRGEDGGLGTSRSHEILVFDAGHSGAQLDEVAVVVIKEHTLVIVDGDVRDIAHGELLSRTK